MSERANQGQGREFTQENESAQWWKQPLSQLNPDQWERLCDGCGKCCLHKLQDEASDQLFFTSVACRFLDLDQVRCRCYRERLQNNPDCIVITKDNLEAIVEWLPLTCAYRLRFLEMPLPQWHPLITGSSCSIVEAGQSVQHRCISEDEVGNDVDWEELVLVDLI